MGRDREAIILVIVGMIIVTGQGENSLIYLSLWFLSPWVILGPNNMVSELPILGASEWCWHGKHGTQGWKGCKPPSRKLSANSWKKWQGRCWEDFSQCQWKENPYEGLTVWDKRFSHRVSSWVVQTSFNSSPICKGRVHGGSFHEWFEGWGQDN